MFRTRRKYKKRNKTYKRKGGTFGTELIRVGKTASKPVHALVETIARNEVQKTITNDRNNVVNIHNRVNKHEFPNVQTTTPFPFTPKFNKEYFKRI